MSAIEAALYSHLTGNERIAALVGDRVYPETIPQEAPFPAIAYQKVSGFPMGVHSGRLNLSESVIQVTISASDYADAKEIANLIKLWFPFRGFLGNLVEIYSSRVQVEVDGYGPQIEAPTVRLDLWFLHSEY